MKLEKLALFRRSLPGASEPNPHTSRVIFVKKHDPGLFEGGLDLEHGREVPLDQPLALLDPLQGGKPDPGLPGQFVLPQSQ
jgi:hypothetical protein